MKKELWYVKRDVTDLERCDDWVIAGKFKNEKEARAYAKKLRKQITNKVVVVKVY